MDPYASLNDPQRQAVTHGGGPLLILAGAGSGKTRVITHRLAELVRRGVAPGRILAVTFTNKAAGELRERAGQLLGEGARPLWIGTFHAISARLLRAHGGRLGLPRDFAVFDDGDQMNVLTQALRGQVLPPQYAEPRALLRALDEAKNQGLGPADLRAGDPVLSRLYDLYDRRLRELGGVDFGDLLRLPVQLCAEHSEAKEAFARLFDHVLVDEFQDVNQVQYALLRLLTERSRQLLVVGDDDQAIYGWRGADVRIILRFPSDWPDTQVVRLEENYRSTQLILDAANALIRRNRERHDKALFSARKGGPAIVLYTAADERREAEFIAATIKGQMKDDGRQPGDFAICYRVNAQARALEEALRLAALPYSVVGGQRFYDRAEVKDVLGYLRLVHNPLDEVALRRIVNVPPRGLGDATVERIAEHARAHGVTLWEALCAFADRAPGAAELRALVEELRALSADPVALAEAVLARTDYLARLGTGREADGRRDNVQELLGAVRAQAAEARARGGALTLGEYLEGAALLSGADARARGVTLLTIHAAKGLEFPVVFVTGLEEGLFPSLRRQTDDDEEDPTAPQGRADEARAVEEERRLAYVAITRARDRLYLCHARKRRLYSDYARETVASRFLDEVPPACLDRRGDGGEAPWQQTARRDQASPPAKGAAPAGAATGLHVGQRVRHATFGEGEVRGLSGAGADVKAQVYFPSAGPKTLLARFLTPLP